MPELARSAKAEGFRAKMWVAPGYVPRRIEITQPDFVAVTDIKDLRFSPSLPASTWQPPADVTDIYWTDSDMLDSVLFVVMNSLKMKEGDQPWLRPDEDLECCWRAELRGVNPPRTRVDVQNPVATHCRGEDFSATDLVVAVRAARQLGNLGIFQTR